MKKNDTGIMDNAKLHDDIENIPSNNSGNRPFASVLESNMTRRGVLGGSLAVAATSFLAPTVQAGWSWGHHRPKSELVGFKPVAISDVTDATMPTISDDYQYQVLAPWGTPIEPGITSEYKGDPNSRPTSSQAALQTGLGHDGMWFFPMDQHDGVIYGKGYHMRSNAGMLCVNHEYGSNSHALGKSTPESLEEVRLSQNVHGVSVLKIEKDRRHGWKVVASKNTRRITANTPVAFSGPAADSELLQNPNGNIALGTVNNCGSGATPWGTYLTCEENFNGYFGANNAFNPTEEQDRYGFSSSGFGYGWHLFDKRFDLTDEDYINEQNRFGWIVEIDPFDGTQQPVKRTALGRFKHEAIAIAESQNGRIAAYMGDDQRFDYCYKYVSDKAWKSAIADGESPLDDGRLFVAKFNDDGTGEWLELTVNNPVLSARFQSQAEVLIYARIAADLLGATPMDRPEWTTIGTNGEVFWTCTNNSNRTEATAANPEAPNNDGHIIRTLDNDDHMGNTFVWDIYLIASTTRGTEGVFTDPDAAWADPYGRLFIGTDGGQPDGLQDQLVVFDTTKDTPEPKRLLVGVKSDEITGFTVTPDQRTAFVNIQHPGDGNPSATNFPAPYDGTTIPRDCTLVITRKDGGIIGS
ncbi:PhoX family phosphatase [Aestuariicella sp. G3-2]|uniref:PhoX family protein n=1 Tax=Pseudomaricurvus albidus TaxID=2842452 RepID=UPI001C0BB113|nr:PhoX family phosphatase [Aestuariicella albida]MBU3070905.1 PhoX family phosphatase [Aestuariicella albida]